MSERPGRTVPRRTLSLSAGRPLGEGRTLPATIGLFACRLPAHRADRITPTGALHTESRERDRR